MAQTGYTPISIYYSATSTNVPTAGNLVAGELAINTADGKLFYKDSAGVVQVIGTKGGVGSSTTTQVLYNSSGLVVGSANMTFSGTALTLANDASISGLTVGKGASAVSTNSVLGYQAGQAVTSGGQLVAIGYQSAYSNTTGGDNVAIGGYQALYSNTSGGQNIAIGRSALQANTTGSENTAIGYQSLYSNTVTSDLCAVGHQAMYSNTTGSNNTAVGGYRALYANTTGSYNTAIGQYALTANTTASNHTAIGYKAGYSKTSGDNYGSVFVGYQAGYQVSTGTDNTLIGASAGQAITTAYNNTAIGGGALYSTTANSNTAIGYLAGQNATTGLANTFVGNGSGNAITTGGYNVILGGFSGNSNGLDIRTTSNYIVLSDGSGSPKLVATNDGRVTLNCVSEPNGTTNGFGTSTSYTIMSAAGTVLYVNRNSSTGAIQEFRYNNSSVGTISTNGSNTAYNTSSDYRLKENVAPMIGALQTVSALKPVTYTWKNTGIEDSGFIAHELQEILPNAVTGNKDDVDADGKPIYQGIDTSFLVATLTAAIQELKAEFDAYKATHP
jgi:hypothetical protein